MPTTTIINMRLTHSHNGHRPSLWHIAAGLMLAASRVSAFSQQYCSNQNTGSSSSPVTNKYQSNGACSTSCQGFAFAVVQGTKCWCSNYAPSDTQSTSDCGVPCPGYPYEYCGNQDKGLFGFVALGPSPSGTQGAAAATSSNSPSSSSSQSSSTSSTSSSTSSTFSTSTTSSTTSSSESSSSSSTWSPTPITQIMTVTGQIETLTITPSAPPAAVQTIVRDQTVSGGGLSQSPGKIAGIAIAVVLVCVAMIAGLVWFCLRRRHQHDDATTVPSTAGGDTPQRRPSRLSQMGLISTPPTAMVGNNRSPPTLVTSGWSGSHTNGSEKSPADTLGHSGSFGNGGYVDQRLEPAAVWNPIHDNGSHVSIRSFRDDQDYSRRMLRIANPDT